MLNLCIFKPTTLLFIMLYIFETEIPNNKFLIIALKKIYGINSKTSLKLLKSLGIAKNFKTSNLSKEQVSQLIKIIENSNLLITNELKKFQSVLLRNLIEIKSIKGLRRLRGLPVRGQRTHTNGKSAKKQKRF